MPVTSASSLASSGPAGPFFEGLRGPEGTMGCISACGRGAPFAHRIGDGMRLQPFWCSYTEQRRAGRRCRRRP